MTQSRSKSHENQLSELPTSPTTNVSSTSSIHDYTGHKRQRESSTSSTISIKSQEDATNIDLHQIVTDEDTNTESTTVPISSTSNTILDQITLGLGRRNRLTLGQKREVVDLAASKRFTHRELAEKFQVGRTTITNICRQEELIRHETDSADASKKKRKTTKCTYDLRILDECLHKWRMEVKVSSPDTKVTGTVLQQKAMEIARRILIDPYAEVPEKIKLALNKFSGSNGWLDGYRTRFGSFSSKHLHGSDQAAIKHVDIHTRLREIHYALTHVELQDIWTGSEFAIVYKPPTSGEIHPNDGLSESKVGSNGRFTVSLFVSAAGETFDLQVIGTERHPRGLDGMDTKERYRIHYGHSKTGWQVAQTTVTMLKQLNALAKQRKRRFRVILDSAVPHVKAAMILDCQGDQRTFFVHDHLQIYFLPPNFKPPRFHPCHLGIVNAFKAQFRYEMLDTIYTAYNEMVEKQKSNASNEAMSFNPLTFLHTRNVFHWFYVALHSIDSDFIQQCWIQSGLLPTSVVAKVAVPPIKAIHNVPLHEDMHAPIVPASLDENTMSAYIPNDVHATATASPMADTTSDTVSTLPIVYYSALPPYYHALQKLLGEIQKNSPVLLQSMGYYGLSAQMLVDMEGNASVTDPGIDELQIIRSVLQKHGFLSTRKLDEATYTDNNDFESMHDGSDAEPPSDSVVLKAINVLKCYLRVTNEKIPDRVEATVQLNHIREALLKPTQSSQATTAASDDTTLNSSTLGNMTNSGKADDTISNIHTL